MGMTLHASPKMHFIYILVLVFVTVFNIVGSSPFRERHVLNRVPVTKQKQTWADNKDSKKLNHDEHKDDVKNDDDNAGGRIVKGESGNSEKEDNGEENIRPIELIQNGLDEKFNDKLAVSRPIPMKLSRDEADVKDNQGAPEPKPIQRLKGNAEINEKRLKDEQTLEIKPIALLGDEVGVSEKENENQIKPIGLVKDMAENEKGVFEVQSNTDDRNTDKENSVIQSEGGNGDGNENIPSEKDENDEDTEGKPPINEQQAEAFQKYHAEKISHMQEAMANNWPLGIIPYKFDTSSFDNILALRVRDAMDFLEGVSCVQFKALTGRRPDNFSWIHITNPEKERECSHKTKKKSSGEIVLTLGLECLKRRDILHSLLHAIGFKDEVTHPHRDQYIRIMWENVQPKYQNLFALSPGDRKVLVEYDPMSIMHFHDRAYSKNGQATIVPLMPGLQIQPSDKLSQLDKMRLRLAFGHECNRRTVDDLFDTCKSVMHKQSKGEDDEENIDRLKKKQKRTPLKPLNGKKTESEQNHTKKQKMSGKQKVGDNDMTDTSTAESGEKNTKKQKMSGKQKVGDNDMTDTSTAESGEKNTKKQKMSGKQMDDQDKAQGLGGLPPDNKDDKNNNQHTDTSSDESGKTQKKTGNKAALKGEHKDKKMGTNEITDTSTDESKETKRPKEEHSLYG